MTAQTPAIPRAPEPGTAAPTPATGRPNFVGNPGSILGMLVGWLVAPTTWLAAIHIFAGFFLGLFVFLVLILGLAFGIGLLAVFGLGIVAFMGTYRFAARFAAFERARFEVLLGEQIPTPPSPAGRDNRRRYLALAD